ncbi:unnamed protein product [Agarophyton chilense]|eukprot:gb/GEZJ01003643.1/.p1 GENE.gb/GEZJ01003643.1/~~gb/GEZJ01003643.1/.p1  ORF type:complete len:531 (-),score=80.03 gb/GEZJ01003643.1/:179-1672(-)
MALVCFPFKDELVPTLLRNVQIAASHSRVRLVLLVAACRNACYDHIRAALDARNASKEPYAAAVRLIVQARLGSHLRSGKGDGMNTALQYFLEAHRMPENSLLLQQRPLQRLHFYDADIESFDQQWISKAEHGVALGYDVVRHYFPRSSTDAQVTWQVTRLGFALLWPRSSLPWVQQPLGGELCLSRRVVHALVSDQRVLQQSDWGIDTMYTFVCAQKNFSLLEVYVARGKIHALYGGLHQLKSMLCECFGALQSVSTETVHEARGGSATHRVEPAQRVPHALAAKVGYDVEKSLGLLATGWSERQRQLLREHFEPVVRDGLLAAAQWPRFMFMDETRWIGAFKVMLQHFDLRDGDWCELLFKMWVARVLNYTVRHVLRGYHAALQANADMVARLHMRGDSGGSGDDDEELDEDEGYEQDDELEPTQAAATCAAAATIAPTTTDSCAATRLPSSSVSSGSGCCVAEPSGERRSWRALDDALRELSIVTSQDRSDDAT